MSPFTAAFHALSLAVSFSVASVGFGQTPAAKDPEFVTVKEFKSKIFTLKHRSASQVVQILRPLGSGFRNATLIHNEDDGVATITVRDFPENVASIEEAIKRLDVPSVNRKEVEFHIHVLFASKVPSPTEECADELKEVVGTLKSTLQYRSYVPAASFVQRVAAGSWNLRGMGETTLPVTPALGVSAAKPLKLRWEIRQIQLETPSEGLSTIKFSQFDLRATERIGENNEEIACIRTDLNLKEGEKVVVGTSVIKDRGLIVVLTAKVLK